MRLSIVIPCLDSHEVVRRQLLHFERIGLHPDTELIIVDDGSDPPIENTSSLPVTIHRTNDKRPWTWALARNAGARISSGENLLFFDVDHIVSGELLDFVYGFNGHKVQFVREFGVLDEQGQFTQDREVLARYGLPLTHHGLKVRPLPNNFAMRRDLFWELGGYREDLVERPYPQGEDRLWKKTWYEYQRRTGNYADPHRPTIYVFPVGKLIGDVDADPLGLFHKLTRKTSRNHWWKEQKRVEG